MHLLYTIMHKMSIGIYKKSKICIIYANKRIKTVFLYILYNKKRLGYYKNTIINVIKIARKYMENIV